MSVSIPSFGDRDPNRQYVARPSAYLVIRDPTEQLAVVRTPLGFFLPGGGIGPGETPSQAAEREAREECGFVVRLTAEIGVADQYVYASAEKTHFLKRSWFFRAQQTGWSSPSEVDHRVMWLSQDRAAITLSHASHRWAVARDGSEHARGKEEDRVRSSDSQKTSKTKRVIVVRYDSDWPHVFIQERDRLAEVLGPAASVIHHIGSTSVPDLCAKPVIDMLAESPDLALIDSLTPRMENLGYTAKGEYGIPGRRYFSRSDVTGPKVHLHIFRSGDPQIGRHLRFRDYLRAHPVAAEKYGALKQTLATRHGDDADAYQAGKASFIAQIDTEAATWADKA
jgi:GrpB-like predicted nucleotidyltransferase (UPF0157 family)/8-oxo-dGTP pyrophosphatase MutT (NUDIX family)